MFSGRHGINRKIIIKSIKDMDIFKVAILLYFILLANLLSASTIDTLKFKVSSEGHLLYGLLLKKNETQEQVPAIIFLVGSGGESSHKTNYKNFLKFFFEDSPLIDNYAIVYFDKRGVGESEGKWHETTFEQRALDAKNVAEAIQKLDFINKDKIFVAGHSQGGWIAQIAVAKYPSLFAGGISMAGATFGVRKQLINDYYSEFICEKGMEEPESLKRATKKAKRALLFVSMIGIKANWKQLKLIKDFEPKIYLQSIQKPFLFILAENDALVKYEWSVEELEEIFHNKIPVNMEVYKAMGETHSFKLAPMCYNGNWSEIKYSQLTQQKIYDWFSHYSKE